MVAPICPSMLASGPRLPLPISSQRRPNGDRTLDTSEPSRTGSAEVSLISDAACRYGASQKSCQLWNIIIPVNTVAANRLARSQSAGVAKLSVPSFIHASSDVRGDRVSAQRLIDLAAHSITAAAFMSAAHSFAAISNAFSSRETAASRCPNGALQQCSRSRSAEMK